MNKKIAIQGYEGSFHQEAAIKYFGGKTSVICCPSFRDVVNIAKNTKISNGGLMAIENSIAGSILPNYALLQKSNLQITGEIYLQIKQQLLVNKGVKLEDIKEVHSHPMAIQQCLGFLDKYPWKLVETEDTALSAKHIQQHNSKKIAAIAGKTAATIYNLEIIKPNIHTLKNNYTRFLVLETGVANTSTKDSNKASIHFQTNHQKGSLAKALQIIASAQINLSKLQSMPIPGTHFSYQFHADLEFDNIEQLKAAIKILKSATTSLHILGIYKNGQTKPTKAI